MRSSHHQRRLEQIQESWNRPLLELKPGDLVLYCGRLAEVIKPGSVFDPAVLEVTDDGGVTHSYTITSSMQLTFLGKDGECVLDDVMAATVRPTEGRPRRRRVAEEWLADPRVGDMFEILEGELLEIVEVGEAGGLWAALQTKGERPVVTGLHFSSARRLRQRLSKKTMPVYNAAAVATMRADFVDDPEIFYHRKSPLWTGPTPSEQIAQGDQVK